MTLRNYMHSLPLSKIADTEVIKYTMRDIAVTDLCDWMLFLYISSMKDLRR